MPSCQSGDDVRQQFVFYLQQYCTGKDKALRDEAHEHLVELLLSVLPKRTPADAMALAKDILREYTTDRRLRELWKERGTNANPSCIVEEVLRRHRFCVHLQEFVNGNQGSLERVRQVLREMVEERLSDLPWQSRARLIEEILPECATDKALHKLHEKQGERANPSQLTKTIANRVRFAFYVEDWFKGGNKCSRDKAFEILYDLARRIASASSPQEAEDLPGEVFIQIDEQVVQCAWEKHGLLIDPSALVRMAIKNQLWRNNRTERNMDGLIKEFCECADASKTPFAKIVEHILTSAGVTDDRLLDEVIGQLKEHLVQIYREKGANKGKRAKQVIVNVLSSALQPYGRAFQWEDFRKVACEGGYVLSVTSLEESSTDEDGNITEQQIADRSMEWQPEDYVMRKHAFDPLSKVLRGRYFQVIVAKFCWRYDDKEIAELLCISESAVRQNLSRAQAKLREGSQELSDQLGIPAGDCITRLLAGDPTIMKA